MNYEEKRELRQLTKEGYSFREIRDIVDCADSTIRNYLKVFRPDQDNLRDEGLEEFNKY